MQVALFDPTEERTWLRPVLMIAGMASAASVLALLFTGQISEYASLEADKTGTVLSFIICGCIAVVLMFVAPLMDKARRRRNLAVLTLVASLLWSIPTVLFISVDFPMPSDALIIHLALNSLGQTLTMLLIAQWNYHFTLNTIPEAAKLSAITIAIAAALYILVSWLAAPSLLIAVLLLVSAASLVILKSSTLEGEEGDCFADSAEQPSPPLKRSRISRANLVSFFALRGVWGLVIGVFVGCLDFGANLPPVSGFVALVATILLVLYAAQTAYVSQSKRSSVMMAIIAPTFIALAIVSCFYLHGFDALMRPLAASVILIWIIALCIQLPTYRSILHLSTSTLAYAEKLIPYAICSLTAAFFINSDLPESTIRPFIELFPAVFFLFFIFAIAILVLHIGRYYPRFDRNTVQNTSQEKSDAVVRIARKFELTARETEVLAYLAQGYSRPYIEKKLCISQGTAKSHIHRIYQKTDIAGKDALIEFIQTYPEQPEPSST